MGWQAKRGEWKWKCGGCQKLCRERTLQQYEWRCKCGHNMAAQTEIKTYCHKHGWGPSPSSPKGNDDAKGRTPGGQSNASPRTKEQKEADYLEGLSKLHGELPQLLALKDAIQEREKARPKGKTDLQLAQAEEARCLQQATSAGHRVDRCEKELAEAKQKLEDTAKALATASDVVAEAMLADIQTRKTPEERAKDERDKKDRDDAHWERHTVHR